MIAAPFSGCRETSTSSIISLQPDAFRRELPEPPRRFAPAGSQDSLRSVASAVTASCRKDIGRSLRGQVFATKQRSDAGAHLCTSPSATPFLVWWKLSILFLSETKYLDRIFLESDSEIWSKTAKTPR